MTVITESNKEAVLMCPDFIKPYRQRQPDNVICVDIGIENVIQELWKNKVITLGCCSGHGKRNPVVIVDDRNDEAQIRKIIKSVDESREWDIYFGDIKNK